MNIINKIFKLGIVILGMSVAISSCSDYTKLPIYTPTNEDVSWSDESKNLLLSIGDNINITLQRGVATSPISLELNLTDTNNLVTLKNSTIDFAVDEYSKEIELDVNYANFLPGKDYSFSIAFNNQYKGPAGYDTIKVVAKLKLEYEEYLKMVPTHCVGRFKDQNSNNKEDGCVIPSLSNDTCTIYKAKGTDNYYKIVFYKNTELEFWLNNNGFIKTDKYSGYNDNLSYTASNGRIGFTVETTATGEGKYEFTGLVGTVNGFFPTGWDVTTASTVDYIQRTDVQVGDLFYFTAWIKLNGNYLANSYTIFNVFKVIALD